MIDGEYWAELPPDQQARLREAALRFRGMVPDPPDGPVPKTTLLEVLAWLQLEADVLDAHAEWLGRLRAKCAKGGRDWTREEFLRMVRLGEVGE